METTTNEPRIIHFDKPRKAIENVTGPWKSRFDFSVITPKMKPEDVKVYVQIIGAIFWALAGLFLSMTFLFFAWHQGRAMIAACLGA